MAANSATRDILVPVGSRSGLPIPRYSELPDAPPAKARNSLRVLVLRCLALFTLVHNRICGSRLEAQATPGPSTQSSLQAAKAPQTPGVVSTAGAHAAVLDAEKRPITSGGFVDSGPTVFQAVSEKARLTRWRHVMETPEKTFILETVGSGVALPDYDQDEWLDIYLVNGVHLRCPVGKGRASARRAVSQRSRWDFHWCCSTSGGE